AEYPQVVGEQFGERGCGSGRIASVPPPVREVAPGHKRVGVVRAEYARGVGGQVGEGGGGGGGLARFAAAAGVPERAGEGGGEGVGGGAGRVPGGGGGSGWWEAGGAGAGPRGSPRQYARLCRMVSVSGWSGPSIRVARGVRSVKWVVASVTRPASPRVRPCR